MAYETEIPPVPDRQQELAMIQGIKRSFQEQPYWKYYMNEGVRTRKLEFYQQKNNYDRTWYGNFIRGSLFASILLFPLANLYRKTSIGVPMFFQPKHFITGGNKQYKNEFRNLKAMRFYYPAVILCGYLYAVYRTSTEPIMDEYYDNKSVILPY